MDWTLFKLVDGGWNCTCSADGWTLTAQLFTLQNNIWPQRGDFVTTSGACAVPARFVGYKITDVEYEALSSAGPYLFTVTAHPKNYNDGDSTGTKLSERTWKRERRVATVHQNQVKKWPFDAKKKSVETSLEFVTLDFYTGTRTENEGSIPSGIVRTFPAWTGIPDAMIDEDTGGAPQNKWRIFSASVAREADNDGISIRHVTVELAAAASKFGGWKLSRYGLTNWNDL